MRLLLAALVALALPNLAFAEGKKTTETTLFPGALDMPIVDGANVPSDCQFPARLRNASHYDLACVVMPREGGDDISAQYLGFLGQHGWHEGPMVIGGFSAVKPAEHDCQNYLGIYPHDFPVAATRTATTGQSADVVLWFALDRQPHCSTPRAQ